MAVKLFGITYRNAFVSRACHGCRIQDIHIRCHCKKKMIEIERTDVSK